jgi:ubiquinone/menaquinone biosynthesis C-methylase UbiE
VNSNPSVERYNRRATAYESGALGRWHADIVERTAALTKTVMPETGFLLDVGCGSGALIRSLARDVNGMTFVGVDPAPQMLAAAASHSHHGRAAFARAPAEALPFRDATFDVVVSSVSFGHWPDQPAGLRECRRVLVDGGALVLVDVFARWLNLATRRGDRHSAHTRSRTTELLRASGFETAEWHDVYGRVIAAVVSL